VLERMDGLPPAHIRNCQEREQAHKRHQQSSPQVQRPGDTASSPCSYP
jgi:hypothetical protein